MTRPIPPSERLPFERCPICDSPHVVRLSADWQAHVEAGAAISIIGCGNPWHYDGLARTATTEAAALAALTPEQEAIADPERVTWTCTVTGPLTDLPPGADFPMRRAVEAAFREVTGIHYTDMWSGWNGSARAAALAATEKLGRDPFLAVDRYGNQSGPNKAFRGGDE